MLVSAKHSIISVACIYVLILTFVLPRATSLRQDKPDVMKSQVRTATANLKFQFCCSLKTAHPLTSHGAYI